eukprot:gnl/TRDRNA2_/TRDRNA2_151582_c1_seq1.p1 gnl/TRDRNA2_/TRDRNA2_151582_c1~~gnl/TRDRNA2_/TRDRNA2_151582_c1_seq1.p1  ORF type:complete len:109 (+),score=1.04 gnl/TRDRNA2_/TRDRNA2_151582_c1_seq1:147-473(+)
MSIQEMRAMPWRHFFHFSVFERLAASPEFQSDFTRHCECSRYEMKAMRVTFFRYFPFFERPSALSSHSFRKELLLDSFSFHCTHVRVCVIASVLVIVPACTSRLCFHA